MDKKIARNLGLPILGVALLSFAVVMFFQYRNAPGTEALAAEGDTKGFDLTPVETARSAYEVPPIVASSPDVIKDSATGSPSDTVPPPRVTESVDENGNVIQTPNWEAQKELAPGTDLSNPESTPEYVSGGGSTPSGGSQGGGTGSTSSGGGQGSGASSTPSGGSSAGSADPSTGGAGTGTGAGAGAGTGAGSSSSAPNNGDTKTIDGETYSYFEGFGWVKDGNGGGTEYIHAPTTGNTVGY